MKKDVLLLALLWTLVCNAQQSNDSIKTYHLGEVVVEASKQYAINNGIAYVPAKIVKQHSMNVMDMLSKMMPAGLRVDMNSKIETTYKGEVHLFIDGVEASDWEVNALKTRDVQRVEYLQSPADPKFMNYQAVVNFVMVKYKYGGYAVAEGSQGFINNTGSYGVILKVNHDKWSYQGFVEAYYRRANDIVTDQYSDYLFSPVEVVNRVSIGRQKEHKQKHTAAFNARYTSKDFLLSLSSGFRYNRMPENSSKNVVSYIVDGEIDKSEGESEYTSKSLLPYFNAYFQVSSLPKNSILYGAASLSYNQNDASGTYILDKPIYNASKEDVWLPRVWIAYMFPLYKQNYMTATVDWTSENYMTRYSGTENSLQQLTNNYIYFRLRYNHSFSDNWSLGGQLEIPINSYKVNDGKLNTTPFINGDITLNGKMDSKNSIYAYARISQMPITPNYYNTAVRQDNEIAGIKGNADLKTQRYLYSVFSYSWMPINKFSLNTSLRWEQIIDDIVPYWYPLDGLMVKDMVNSGNYNIFSATVTPSVSLLEGKLNVQAMLYYAYESHTGLINLSLSNYGIFPSASYMINSNFSVSANYNKTFGKGYMRGGSNLANFSDKLNLSAQYTVGNFYAQLTVHSLNRKRGWVKSWFDSDHFNNYEYISRPWDGRYVNIKLRYTFDFGRQTKRGNDPRFEGSAKSSVL